MIRGDCIDYGGTFLSLRRTAMTDKAGVPIYQARCPDCRRAEMYIGQTEWWCEVCYQGPHDFTDLVSVLELRMKPPVDEPGYYSDRYSGVTA